MRLPTLHTKAIFSLILVKQALFALFILTICRAVWLFSNFFWLDSGTFLQYFAAFGFGLFLDLPVLGWFFLPSWIWLLAFPNRSAKSPKTTKLIFVISALAVILLTAIDCGYSRVTARRSGTELLSLLGDEGNHIGPYLAEYWWGWVLFLIGVALVYILTPSKGYSLYIYSKQYPKWKSILFIAITGFVWLTIARGGWRIKPLSSVDAAEFVSPSFSPIASSTPLQFLSTIGQKPVLKYSFMSDAEAEKIVLGNYRIQTQNQKKNVVFLIVESLSRDYTGFLNGKNYTPFLDSLSKLSTNFRFCFANGVRSIEMVPSIFCGIPGIGESQFINSAYAANKIENAYKAFEKQGYATAFFHGAQNGTMRFQAFFAQTGLSNYYGLNEFPSERRTKDVIFTWGVHDEPYLEYVADMTQKLSQPFFISVFTLSSHHPYKIPEKYEKSLPAGTLPIHKTVAYADVSLKNYFAAIQNTAWYKNTIFVITGDHTSYSKDAYFYSQTGHYEVPLLIFEPGKPGTVIDKTVSQCDIVPTVLDMIGLQTDFFGMGRSAFDSTYAGYSIHRDNNQNFAIHYPYTLGMNDKGEVTDFYTRYRNQTTVKHLPRNGEIYNNMLLYLKASMQFYTQKLNSNTWHK